MDCQNCRRELIFLRRALIPVGAPPMEPSMSRVDKLTRSVGDDRPKVERSVYQCPNCRTLRFVIPNNGLVNVEHHIISSQEMVLPARATVRGQRSKDTYIPEFVESEDDAEEYNPEVAL